MASLCSNLSPKSVHYAAFLRLDFILPEPLKLDTREGVKISATGLNSGNHGSAPQAAAYYGYDSVVENSSKLE